MPVGMPDDAKLDAREALLIDYALRGESLKLAAIEMGLSTACVCRLRRRALTKLGYDSICAFLGARARTELLLAVPITPAEREIALSVLSGLSNADIAARRGTSVRTVANQLAQLYRKLRVCSRLELAAAFARAG